MLSAERGEATQGAWASNMAFQFHTDTNMSTHNHRQSNSDMENQTHKCYRFTICVYCSNVVVFQFPRPPPSNSRRDFATSPPLCGRFFSHVGCSMYAGPPPLHVATRIMGGVAMWRIPAGNLPHNPPPYVAMNTCSIAKIIDCLDWRAAAETFPFLSGIN